MTAHKKTAPTAATVETVAENIDSSSPSDPTVSYAYLEDYATLSGAKLRKSESYPLIVPLDTVRRMYSGYIVEIQLHPACIAEHQRRLRIEQRRKREHEELLARRRARDEHEQAVIERITGERVAKTEIEYRLIELYRDGGDVTPWLEALKALDDEALAATGRTSWGDPDDDE